MECSHCARNGGSTDGWDRDQEILGAEGTGAAQKLHGSEVLGSEGLESEVQGSEGIGVRGNRSQKEWGSEVLGVRHNSGIDTVVKGDRVSGTGDQGTGSEVLGKKASEWQRVLGCRAEL